MPPIKGTSSSNLPLAKDLETRRGSKRAGSQRDPHNSDVSPSDGTTTYPIDASARDAFRTCDGKKLTEHQWAVYDFACTIPRGRVTTYSALCKALGKGSPRSVGSALRRNPFSPFVPCHRVIASNLYIGGFFGQWGTSSSGKKSDTTLHQCQKKIEMLAMEGVTFTPDGYLVDESIVWKG